MRMLAIGTRDPAERLAFDFFHRKQAILAGLLLQLVGHSVGTWEQGGM